MAHSTTLVWLWIQCSMFCLLCRVSVTIRVWLSTIHLHAAKSSVGGRETSCCRQTTDNVQRLLLRPSHPQQAAPGRRMHAGCATVRTRLECRLWDIAVTRGWGLLHSAGRQQHVSWGRADLREQWVVRAVVAAGPHRRTATRRSPGTTGWPIPPTLSSFHHDLSCSIQHACHRMICADLMVNK